jgi:hypothetical protein
MQGLRLPVVVTALLVAACARNPSPTNPSPSSTPRASESARFSVTGSGELCGPWWMGCGAVLAVEPPNWRLPKDWSPSAKDTWFAVAVVAGSESPAPVTGIRQLGQDRIGPGAYRFVVIMTMMPDTAPSATLSAALGCSANVRVSTTTRAVSVDVAFGANGSTCTIAVSMDPATVPVSS